MGNQNAKITERREFVRCYRMSQGLYGRVPRIEPQNSTFIKKNSKEFNNLNTQ